MPSIPKEKKSCFEVRGQSEKGFALIAALLSLWVLTALGILVFSISTQDIRISTRVIGEKRAFFAAEAGLHELTQKFDPSKLNDPALYQTQLQVDPATDPDTVFTISFPTTPIGDSPPYVHISGQSLDAGTGELLVRARYLADIQGENRRFNSRVELGTGIGYGPVPGTTVGR